MDSITMTRGAFEKIEARKFNEDLTEEDRKVVSYLANRFRDGEEAERIAARDADWTYTIWEWRF